MPLMNPLGSFSISMFGFLFILDGRTTSDRDVQANLTHTPAARLASSATRPFLAMTSLVILGSLAGHGKHSRVSRDAEYLPWLKVSNLADFSDGKGLRVKISEEFMP